MLPHLNLFAVSHFSDIFIAASNQGFFKDPKTWTSIAAVVFSLVSLWITFGATLRHKEFDITMEFQGAWNELEALKSHVDTLPEAQYWFGRYWNLLLQEFEYWLRGYIRDEIFIYWMRCRRVDYDKPRPFVVISKDPAVAPIDYDYKRGWDDIKGDIIFKDHPYHFREFMDHLLVCDPGQDFAQYILESKEDLFGIFARLDRKGSECFRKDPTKAFHLRKRS